MSSTRIHRIRRLLLLLAVPLPGFLKRTWYRWLFGWQIGRGVRIGFSYLDAKSVELGDNVHIGHFNLMRCVDRFTVGRGTFIANLNTFSGNTYDLPGWVRTLHIGDDCVIMSRHFFDVAGEIRIGGGTTIAGRDSHFWTHTLAFEAGKTRLVAKNLNLGEQCYIGARCTLLYCSLPPGCFVGAGSVVVQSFEPAAGRLLIAGNPARLCREYPADSPQNR